MAISDIPPAPIASLTPKLKGLLKQRLASLLQYLVATNSKTTYFSEAALLADFREALEKEFPTGLTPSIADSIDPLTILETFSSTVPLSNYDDYRPFIARFMEGPRYSSKVSDLLAPGLPAYIVTSSGTSGGAAKYFPKYKHPLARSASAINGMKAVIPPLKWGGSQSVIFNLRYSELLEVIDGDAEQGEVAKKVPLCLGSSVAFRSYYQWSVENDEAIMSTKGTFSFTLSK
jgi:hypothetical protein